MSKYSGHVSRGVDDARRTDVPSVGDVGGLPATLVVGIAEEDPAAVFTVFVDLNRSPVQTLGLRAGYVTEVRFLQPEPMRVDVEIFLAAGTNFEDNERCREWMSMVVR